MATSSSSSDKEYQRIDIKLDLIPNIEKLNHLTGDPEYDKDMELIEMYVKYERNRANEEEHKKIQKYPGQKAAEYWVKLKELNITSFTFFYISEQDSETIIANQRKIETEYIIPKIIELENTDNRNMVEKYIELLVQMTLIDTNQLIRSDILGDYINIRWHKFKFDRKMHINYRYLKTDQLYLKDYLYPLLNGNGAFGINSWLYAFFNRVFLIGFPDSLQSFDDSVETTPDNFAKHDFDHMNEIFELGYKLNNLIKMQKHIDVSQIIYYHILNDPKISNLEKRLHLLFLFLNLHEYTNANTTDIKFEYYKSITKKEKDQYEYEFWRLCTDQISYIGFSLEKGFIENALYTPFLSIYNRVYSTVRQQLNECKYKFRSRPDEFDKALEDKWVYFDVIFSSGTLSSSSAILRCFGIITAIF